MVDSQSLRWRADCSRHRTHVHTDCRWSEDSLLSTDWRHTDSLDTLRTNTHTLDTHVLTPALAVRGLSFGTWWCFYRCCCSWAGSCHHHVAGSAAATFWTGDRRVPDAEETTAHTHTHTFMPTTVTVCVRSGSDLSSAVCVCVCVCASYRWFALTAGALPTAGTVHPQPVSFMKHPKWTLKHTHTHTDVTVWSACCRFVLISRASC